ncbi:MAG TPA: S9 family peptidase [Bryobacteraceae bacterium]|nr:S9 family peptidase [Bryobacteraceae bacterium]
MMRTGIHLTAGKMKRLVFRLLPAVLIVLPGFTAAAAPSRMDAIVDSLSKVLDIKEVAISPDGSRVAWVQETKAGAPVSCVGTAVFSQDLGRTATPSRMAPANGSCDEQGIAWSPDGRSIVFLSDRKKHGQLQLYLKPPAGALRQLTSLNGTLADPKWSPDGKTIALLFTADTNAGRGPTAPKEVLLSAASDRVPEQRIAVINVASGAARMISPADLYIYQYDWSPDGQSFATIAAHGEGDANWYLAQLYTINVASGTTRSIWKPSLQIAEPRWSPDGKNIAVVQGLMSDEGNTGGDLFLVPASGGGARNVTPGMKASVSWLTWLDASRILFAESVEGEEGLASIDVRTRQITTLWRGSDGISTGGFNGAVSLMRDGKLQAVVLQSFERPPEVWAGPVGKWSRITHINPAVEPAWGKVQSLRWGDAAHPGQGWLLYPVHHDPARRYPMVVAVHGGPGSMSRPRWPGNSSSPYIYNLALLAHEGYFVFYPNPRGSFGQGEAFTQANVKDFGYGDLQDILHGVDQAIRSAPVDKDRVGIAGWSYGGYMAMWAVTQTNRFRASVAGAGIANWQSYYGQNGIDQWMIPFFGQSVYDNPAVYARSSPINFIKNVRTPTIMLVGEKDGECPPPQSLEFWHALKALGVTTKLVVYPGEGHRIGKPEHRRDVMSQTLEWFNRYMAAR